MPLHTLRANIDYGFAEAKTTMGQIGIKVWIFLGEKAVRQKERRHSVLGPDEEGTAEGAADPAELLAQEEERRKGSAKAAKDAKPASEQEFFDDEDMEGFDAAAEDA